MLSVATSIPADAEIQNVVAATTAFLNLLTPAQRSNVQFTFTARETAKAANFSRSGSPGKPSGEAAGGPGGQPNPMTQSRPRRGSGGGPGGGPGMGPPGGFIGEQYGQAVWSNYPVSDVPRPGHVWAV